MRGLLGLSLVFGGLGLGAAMERHVDITPRYLADPINDGAGGMGEAVNGGRDMSLCVLEIEVPGGLERSINARRGRVG